MSTHAYTARVDIAASAEAVWSVLADLPAYRAWNPLTPRVRSALTPGSMVWMWVRLGWLVVPQWGRVRDVSPPRSLSWDVIIVSRRLLWAQRVQTVLPIPGGARYETVDTMSGLLVPAVRALLGGVLDDGFAKLAAGLKARAEARGG